jgi:hypothetical protein
MPGGDTIMQAHNELPTLWDLLRDAGMRAICARWGHRWSEYKRPGYGSLPYGKREWCQRCLSQSITFPDGERVQTSAPELKAGTDIAFKEALYEARWGEPPRRRMTIGEWPAP